MDFRNEGVSYKHNPEFTQLEFYQAYSDYLQIMEMTEQMVAYAAEKALGKTTVVFDGKEINLAPPWKRIGTSSGDFGSDRDRYRPVS